MLRNVSAALAFARRVVLLVLGRTERRPQLEPDPEDESDVTGEGPPRQDAAPLPLAGLAGCRRSLHRLPGQRLLLRSFACLCLSLSCAWQAPALGGPRPPRTQSPASAGTASGAVELARQASTAATLASAGQASRSVSPGAATPSTQGAGSLAPWSREAGVRGIPSTSAWRPSLLKQPVIACSLPLPFSCGNDVAGV